MTNTQAYLQYELDNVISLKGGRFEGEYEWLTDYQQGGVVEILPIPDTVIALGYSNKKAESGIDLSEDFHKPDLTNKGVSKEIVTRLQLLGSQIKYVANQSIKIGKIIHIIRTFLIFVFFLIKVSSYTVRKCIFTVRKCTFQHLYIILISCISNISHWHSYLGITITINSEISKCIRCSISFISH